MPLSDFSRAWILDKYGTRVQASAPYMHLQNAAERDVQTVIVGTSVLLHGQRWLRGDCWDLAMAHLRNRKPSKRIKSGKSPFQVLTGETTDFAQTHRFAFGDLLAVANTPSEAKKLKFDEKEESESISVILRMSQDLQLSTDLSRIPVPSVCSVLS